MSSPPPSPEASRRETAAALHELSESLTAITNYVETASRLLHQPARSHRDLAAILDKVSAQIGRTHALMRRLRGLIG
jgi:phosphoglycerate-specific signal transduction histidine kinase